MRQSLALALTLITLAASSAAWSQGGTSGTVGGTPQPGSQTGVSGGPVLPKPATGGPAPLQCKGNLANLATAKLQAQLLIDKAVTKQVLANAAITQDQLGANCNAVCDEYESTVSKIYSAKTSPAYTSEPEHTLQQIYKNMPVPPMPGAAALNACLPPAATVNWCPPSGNGVGAGPRPRLQNPLDKIYVCVTPADALAHMNFSPADAAFNCARPNIVDAADRINAEHVCAADASKAKAAQDAAAAAAANKAAAVYNGPAISATPPASALKGPARAKP